MAEEVSQVEPVAARQIESFSQKAATNTIQENAKVQNDAGLEVRVTRIYDGIGVHMRKDPCEWCLERCGENMPYSEAYSKGAFERHPGCHCEIFYKPKKGGWQRQSDWKNNAWEDTPDSGIIKIRKRHDPGQYEPDFFVGKSLSAAFKDIIVRLPDGSLTRLTPGTKIEKIQTIAGLGKKRKIDEIDVLTSIFEETASSPELWKKQKGMGYVDYDGESYRADLHFYSHPLTDKVRFKVKPDAGGNWFYDEY